MHGVRVFSRRGSTKEGEGEENKKLKSHKCIMDLGASQWPAERSKQTGEV